MQVKVKSFDVGMDVKSKGIEFEVRKADGSAQIGDCYITMTGLVWCEGRKSKAKGTKLSWEEFQEIMQSSTTQKAALKAARTAK